jgi:hypothetical protein
MRKATRAVPIVFVGSEPDKTEQIRELLPDAVFTSWERAARELARAKPLASPVVPGSVFAQYAGDPLDEKLGVAAGMRVGLVGAPRDFAVAGVRNPRSACDLVLWFVEHTGEIERDLARVGGLAPSFWIVWRKGLKGGLTQAAVRRIGLARGYVDYKVVSIDKTWTGLRFRKRTAR